jgi:hypothetical protein
VGLFSRGPPPGGPRSPGPSASRLLGADGATSYATVDVTSGETALQSVAVRSAVDLICSLATELPVDVYRGKGPDRQHLKTPGYLLDPAGDGYGLQDWSYQVLGVVAAARQRLRRGPGPGVPRVSDADLAASPRRRVGLHRLRRERPLARRRPAGRTAGGLPAPPGERGAGPGAGPVGHLGARRADRLSLTTTQFGLQWFQDGAHPGGILTNEEADLNPDQAKTVKERFLAALRGTREPAVMGKGWKYQQVQIAPGGVAVPGDPGLDRERSAPASSAPVCRGARLRLVGSGTSLTYTNRVDRSADLLQFALNKWLRRMERLLSEMLPSPAVRADRPGRAAGDDHSGPLPRLPIALQNGFRVIDEVREDEDMRPSPWGNKPFALPKPRRRRSPPTRPRARTNERADAGRPGHRADDPRPVRSPGGRRGHAAGARAWA